MKYQIKAIWCDLTTRMTILKNGNTHIIKFSNLAVNGKMPIPISIHFLFRLYKLSMKGF